MARIIHEKQAQMLSLNALLPIHNRHLAYLIIWRNYSENVFCVYCNNIPDEQEDEIIELSPRNVLRTSTALSLELISVHIRNPCFSQLTVAPALEIAPSNE